ncbi:MAG: ABC transporter ATP-binding protein [Thermodesulfobacteria bacterium]|nr:ABC transporter ATP-binding protein [Thermodesulfobacteriota bacterium]
MASVNLLEAKNVALGYGEREVVRFSLALRAGEWVSLIGPNGAGKSTILHGLAGLLPLRAGEVYLAGEPLSRLTPRERARRVALMRQSPGTSYPFTAFEIVLQGRYPHGPSPQDEEMALKALERVGALHLAARPFPSLSGGERQKVWLARIIAQQTPLLLLDEPASHLDPAVSHEIYRLLRELCAEGKAVLCVLHDLVYASLMSNRVILLKKGRFLASGPPEEVLRPELLEELFEAPFLLLKHPLNGKPLPLPSVGL